MKTRKVLFKTYDDTKLRKYQDDKKDEWLNFVYHYPLRLSRLMYYIQVLGRENSKFGFTPYDVVTNVLPNDVLHVYDIDFDNETMDPYPSVDTYVFYTPSCEYDMPTHIEEDDRGYKTEEYLEELEKEVIATVIELNKSNVKKREHALSKLTAEERKLLNL